MVARCGAALVGVYLACAPIASSSSPSSSPGAAEDDSSCLLQTTSKAFHAKPATVGSSGEGPAKMLQEMQAIAKRVHSRGGQATPEEDEMIATVAQMIDDVSLPALEADRIENQRQLERVGEAVNSCEAIRVNMDTEVGGVEERRLLVATSRVSHRSCRVLEGELETDKSAKCGNFMDYAGGLVPPTSALPNPAEPSELMDVFLRSNHEWFSARYDSYMLHKQQCEQSTNLHVVKLLECAGSQTAFETASCAMPASMHSMCAPYSACRDGAESQQTATWEDVISSEEERKLSFITLKKIKCLILSLAEEGDARGQAITACGITDVEIQYDGSEFDPGHLNMTYIAIAPRVMCSEQGGLLPCDAMFIAEEYAAPVLPANAQAATCVPCVGEPAILAVET